MEFTWFRGMEERWKAKFVETDVAPGESRQRVFKLTFWYFELLLSHWLANDIQGSVSARLNPNS